MGLLALRGKCHTWDRTDLPRRVFELGLSVLVGLMAGALVVFSGGLSAKWQELIVVVPIVVAVVLLVNDLEKVVLAAIAIGVPLNLDVSLIISPYAHVPENIARGHRTLATLTELRLSLISVLLIVGYALWLIKPRDSGHKPIRLSAGITVPALGFIFFSILSVFRARDWQLSMFRVVQLLEVLLAYFYLANHLRTVQQMQFFIMVSLGAMCAESILIIVQWATGLEFIVAGIQAVAYGGGRVGGTLGATGPAAGYLSAQALIACAMIWAFPKKWQRIFAAVSFGLGTIALVGTGSRIGWIAYAVTILLYVLIGLRAGKIKRGSLLLLVVVVATVGVFFFDAIYTRYTADDRGSAEARPKMNRLAWNMIRAHPWLGVGAGNQALATREYYTPDVGDPGNILDIQTHNQYLLVWAESGLFALLCYVGILGGATLKSWLSIKSDHHWISMMGTGLGCAIVSLCIQMLTGTFHMRAITLFVWLLLALAASLHNLARDYPAYRPTVTSRDSLAERQFVVVGGGLGSSNVPGSASEHTPGGFYRNI